MTSNVLLPAERMFKCLIGNVAKHIMCKFKNIYFVSPMHTCIILSSNYKNYTNGWGQNINYTYNLKFNVKILVFYISMYFFSHIIDVKYLLTCP